MRRLQISLRNHFQVWWGFFFAFKGIFTFVFFPFLKMFGGGALFGCLLFFLF